MNRLIWTAWRAFWVGLGASAVLIGQSVLVPAPEAFREAPPAIEQPMYAPAHGTTEPALSRMPAPKGRIRHAS